MPRQGKGSIVNISSSYGKVGVPSAAAFVGSKHAVEGITKSAAIELAGTDVRVNIVGLVRQKRECSTVLRKRRKTKQISSRHTFLQSAWVLPKKSQMPSCSLALTGRPTSSVHPFRSTEECSRADSDAAWKGRHRTSKKSRSSFKVQIIQTGSITSKSSRLRAKLRLTGKAHGTRSLTI
jgi:short chain dehydrogenase